MANKYDHDPFLMPMSEKEHDFVVACFKVLGIMMDRVMIYEFLFFARHWNILAHVATPHIFHLTWFLCKFIPKEQKQPLDISIKNDPLIVTIAKINCIVFWMERVALILPFFGIGTWVYYLTSYGFVLSTMIYFANVYAVFIYSKVQVIPKISSEIKQQKSDDENSHEVKCCNNGNKMETDKGEHGEESEKKEEEGASKESHENDYGEEELDEIDHSRFDIEMVKARDELGTEMMQARHELDILWGETIHHEQRVEQIINNYQRIMDETQSIWERKMKKIESEREEQYRKWEELETLIEKHRRIIFAKH